MVLSFGIHTGPQYCSMVELHALWRRADQDGFDWISVWDHFYPAVIGESHGDCFEGVASMSALAAATSRVTVGCLVFCVFYPHPAVLAKAAVTIDHVSGGRMELGLGIGWHQTECDTFGIAFPTLRERLDRLEETAHSPPLALGPGRGDVRRTPLSIAKRAVRPKPIGRPRIWIGGVGERRLLRIVAKHADGWNTPFLAPETFARKDAVLERWCAEERRDSAAILRSANLGLAIAADERAAERTRASLADQFGPMLPLLEPGMLVGTPEQIIDRVAAYEKAGAQRIILAPPSAVRSRRARAISGAGDAGVSVSGRRGRG